MKFAFRFCVIIMQDFIVDKNNFEKSLASTLTQFSNTHTTHMHFGCNRISHTIYYVQNRAGNSGHPHAFGEFCDDDLSNTLFATNSQATSNSADTTKHTHTHIHKTYIRTTTTQAAIIHTVSHEICIRVPPSLMVRFTLKQITNNAKRPGRSLSMIMSVCVCVCVYIRCREVFHAFGDTHTHNRTPSYWYMVWVNAKEVERAAAPAI